MNSTTPQHSKISREISHSNRNTFLTFRQQYLGMEVLPNEPENIQQIQPLTYSETRAIFYFKHAINGSYIGLRNKDSTIYALQKNCTLVFISLENDSRSQEFKPNCLQLLIDKDQSHLAILYPDSIILYNTESDQVETVEYNYTDAVTDIRLTQKYILISKGLQGMDMLSFQGELILNNFMANKNILQASIHANRLVLLFDGGLLIFNFKLSPRLINEIQIDECVRFEHNNKLFIIQTKTKILEYFWKNLLVNQEIITNSEVTSISLHQEYLQFISNGRLYQKLVGIIKDDFNLSKINVTAYETKSTRIVGYQEKNQLILQNDQQFEIVFWHFQPAFLIFKPKTTGLLTCLVDLYQKDTRSFNSTVEIVHYKIYIEVIEEEITTFEILIIMVVILSLIILFYIIRRIVLIQILKKKTQKEKKDDPENESKTDSEFKVVSESQPQEEVQALNTK
ncbi:unnamed protein product (macronuclear) [Paramecium tetraurelia]|uniref:Transmembrane protein n=1 Tax=Paramecium tetraurelia TaxID=5888 RepID=A0C101_PARTE|nr:uncharacterized protein GSPATT00033944001 [Paramecium tetraurelia]CAK64468.1 unnamed protein product [Paramecium tetraurelia]|eukprot:XP_001431866.1 hypothetical protein (macronuclear) [Paramecium tetraurelia strain d4-2]